MCTPTAISLSAAVDEGSQFWCFARVTQRTELVLPSFAQVTAVNLGGSIVSSELINPEGLAGQIFLAVYRSGTATNNNIYMLASVQPTGATSGTDVMFVRSTTADGASAHRTESMTIPSTIVSGIGSAHFLSRLMDALMLFGCTRETPRTIPIPSSSTPSSTDGGNTWSPNIALSNSFNPFICYPNQRKIGDYITIVSDNTGGNVAYAATFNGEEDVYYLRVPENPRWSVVGVADFNLDGHPDYLLYNGRTRRRDMVS